MALESIAPAARADVQPSARQKPRLGNRDVVIRLFLVITWLASVAVLITPR
jgi:hypothetical protein